MSSILTEGSICPIDKVILGLILNLVPVLNLGVFKRLRDKMKNIILIAGLALFAFGCDGNHIIGDLPNCIDSVTDECVPEVIEEFCDPCDPACDICQTWDEAREQDARLCKICMGNAYQPAYDEGFAAGYDAGFADGVDSVTCECPTWPPEDGCSYPDDAPPGHLIKECRGRPDKN